MPCASDLINLSLLMGSIKTPPSVKHLKRSSLEMKWDSGDSIQTVSLPTAEASAGDGDEGAEAVGHALQATPDVVAAHSGQAPAPSLVAARAR